MQENSATHQKLIFSLISLIILDTIPAMTTKMTAIPNQKIDRLIELLRKYLSAGEAARIELGYGDILSMGDIFNVSQKTKTELAALRGFVQGLPDDDKREICAIMLLGRGDFDAYGEALNHCNDYPIETAAEYIL